MDSKINPRKRSRNTIQLIKHRIMRDYEDGARVKDLAEKYNYAQITMARLLGSKQKLRKLENNTIIMEMEKLLFDWIKDKQKRNEPVTDTAIIQKAIKLYDILMAETSNTCTEGFRAHESWFNRFCRDAGIEIDKVTRLVKKLLTVYIIYFLFTTLKEKEVIRATNESSTSTSEDYPVKQKGIVDEVDDAVKSSEKVKDSSNSIYIQETYKETKDCPPHKISTCTQYLNNNDNIESEFNSSVSNEHIENNNKDGSTLLSTLPPSRTRIENIKENSIPLRVISTVTRTRTENNIKDNSALLRTIPTSTLTRIENNINDNSTLSRTLLTPTLTRIENNNNDNSTLI
ncbi:Tigger transposable element-derived protein 1, partial [Armadillidium nasatum]